MLGRVSGTLKDRVESGFAGAITAVSAWDDAVSCDAQSISQTLRFPKVNVWKIEIKMKMVKIKMKMVNVTWMQFKVEMLNVVAKCRGSVTGKSGFILLSSRFPISILNSVCLSYGFHFVCLRCHVCFNFCQRCHYFVFIFRFYAFAFTFWVLISVFTSVSFVYVFVLAVAFALTPSFWKMVLPMRRNLPSQGWFFRCCCV